MRLSICLLLCLICSLQIAAKTKRALVIGLGVQADKEWAKINGDKDVAYVKDMLRTAGFRQVTTLVNQQATKAAVVKAFKQLARACDEGDVVYVHYSGHGQQMRDVHGDEVDGLDECWIPYDAYLKACDKDRGEKHLTDDEVNYYLSAIRRRVGEKGKIFVVVDACHSGDATRGLADDEVVRGVERIFEAAKALVARGKAKPENHPNAKRLPELWVTISACRSDEVNVEMKNPAVGKLTYALYRELQVNGGCNNDQLMLCIRKFFKYNASSAVQNPQMTGYYRKRDNLTDILR